MGRHRVEIVSVIYTDEQDGTIEQTAEIWQGLVEQTLYEHTAADRVYCRVLDYDDLTDHPSAWRTNTD